MALDTIQQIKQSFEHKKHILITFKKSYGGDALGSAIALKLMFKYLNKQADIVCDDFAIQEKYNFLKYSKHIANHIGHLKQFVINVDIADTGIAELSYDNKDKKLRIFITPQKGYISKEAITTAQTDFRYDCIVVLDTPDLHSLGNIYTKHEEFFYAVPVINIDHKSSNEQFGHINHIVEPASSTSEIMYDILHAIGEEHVDRHIAQALLTGIVAGTMGFREKKVRPQTLTIASKLSEYGADRNFIMKKLFQTKSIHTFRLWGNILSRLEHDPDHKLVWTTLTRDDMVRNNATAHDIHGVVEELITTSEDAHYILVLHEDSDGGQEKTIHGFLKVVPAYDATAMLKKYDAIGDENNAHFHIQGKTLVEAEQEIISHVKEQIKLHSI